MSELPEVRRFNFFANQIHPSDSGMVIDNSGSFVSYADYESLRQRLASVENDLKDALDLKELKGPTALGAVVSERDELRQCLDESDRDPALRICVLLAELGVAVERLGTQEKEINRLTELATKQATARLVDMEVTGELRGRLEAAEKALRAADRGYVNLLEIGRDRIIFLGGDCDKLEVMIAGDPVLKEIRAAIAAEVTK